MFGKKLLLKVLGDVAGTSAVEYALIISFVVLAISTELNVVAEKTIGMWSFVAQEVTAQ